MRKLLSVALIIGLLLTLTVATKAHNKWWKPVGAIGVEVGSYDLVLPVRGGLSYTNNNGLVASGSFWFGKIKTFEKYKTSIYVVSVGEAWTHPDIGWRFGLGLSPVTAWWDTKPENKWKGARFYTMPYVGLGLNHFEEFQVMFGLKFTGMYK